MVITFSEKCMLVTPCYSILIIRYLSWYKESACNAGDPGSIPGSGRAPEEGTDYPLKDSWAFLVAQMVKSLPAVRETWV